MPTAVGICRVSANCRVCRLDDAPAGLSPGMPATVWLATWRVCIAGARISRDGCHSQPGSASRAGRGIFISRGSGWRHGQGRGRQRRAGAWMQGPWRHLPGSADVRVRRAVMGAVAGGARGGCAPLRQHVAAFCRARGHLRAVNAFRCRRGRPKIDPLNCAWCPVRGGTAPTWAVLRPGAWHQFGTLPQLDRPDDSVENPWTLAASGPAGRNGCLDDGLRLGPV